MVNGTGLKEMRRGTLLLVVKFHLDTAANHTWSLSDNLVVA